MNFGFVKDIDPGYGEDAICHGANYAFVCDGLGGKGANRLYHEDGSVRTEAYIASHVSVKAVECIVNAQYSDWKQKLAEPSLVRNAAETLKKEICADIQQELQNWKQSNRKPIMPCTLAGVVAFPETQRALVFWAGDSRVYMLDDEHLYQLGKDDGISVPPLDAMEELLFAAGSLPIGNRIGLDNDFEIHAKMIELPERALLFCTSDGIYNCLQSPMFEEYVLRSGYKLDSSQELCDKLCKKLSSRAEDDISFVALYVDTIEDSYARLKEMLYAGFSAVKDNYVNKCPENKPSSDEYLDVDMIRARVFDKLQNHDGFHKALRGWIRNMEEDGRIPDECCMARKIRDYREAKVMQNRRSVLQDEWRAFQDKNNVPTENEVRDWLKKLYVVYQQKQVKRWDNRFIKWINNGLIQDYDDDLRELLRGLFYDDNVFGKVKEVLWDYKKLFSAYEKQKDKSEKLKPSDINRVLNWLFRRTGTLDIECDFAAGDMQELSELYYMVRTDRDYRRRISEISEMTISRPSEQKLDTYTLNQIVREWIDSYCKGAMLFPVEGLTEALQKDLQNINRAPEINRAIEQKLKDYEETLMTVWRGYKSYYEKYMNIDVSGQPLPTVNEEIKKEHPLTTEVIGETIAASVDSEQNLSEPVKAEVAQETEASGMYLNENEKMKE